MNTTHVAPAGDPAVTAEAGAPLVLRGITQTYESDGRTVQVLHDLSLDVPGGRLVALMGRSGSGKTTALNIASGLQPPTSGHVLVNGADVYAGGERQRAALRRTAISRIFQDFGLIEELTAAENVALALELRGVKPKAARAAAAAALAQFGLTERAQALPHRLSGGEQQRVAIARATATGARIILADEPTANLDETNARNVTDALRAAAATGSAVLVATHDDIVADGADLTIRLR